MKKIIIIFIFLITAVRLSAQEKESSTAAVVPSLLEKVSTTLYTSYYLKSTAKPGDFINQLIFTTTYSCDREQKTITSPNKNYRLTVVPKKRRHSDKLYINDLRTPEQKPIEELFVHQRILSLQFYNDLLISCQKHKIKPEPATLSFTDLSDIKSSSRSLTLNSRNAPAIGYLPTHNLLIISEPTTAWPRDDKVYRRLSFFDVIQLKFLTKKDFHTAHINMIVTHAAKLLVASASNDKTVRIWSRNIRKGIHCKSLLPHKAPVKIICINPEGTYLISGTHDGREINFYLWDLTKKQQEPLFKFPLYETQFSRMPLYCSWEKEKSEEDATKKQPVAVPSYLHHPILLCSDTFYYQTDLKHVLQELEHQDTMLITLPLPLLMVPPEQVPVPSSLPLSGESTTELKEMPSDGKAGDTTSVTTYTPITGRRVASY